MRWWLEGEPFCGYCVDIKWIFLGYSSNVLGIGWLLGLIKQGLIGVGGGGGEVEPYCGYFWDWLVVRVDCTRVKWVRWWLGG